MQTLSRPTFRKEKENTIFLFAVFFSCNFNNLWILSFLFSVLVLVVGLFWSRAFLQKIAQREMK